MQRLRLWISVGTSALLVGCAASTPATCEQQVAAAVERSIKNTGPGAAVVVGLPEAEDVKLDSQDPSQRWALVKLLPALSSPASALYTVQRGVRAAAAEGASSSCDLSQVYVVVQSGGIGAPVVAYGPLNR